MPELIAPTGTPEMVRAAVYNGADAVSMGFSLYNSTRSLGFFNEDEFSAAAEYCRIRGVKTYVNIDTIVTDKHIENALKLLALIVRHGADAAVIGDIGVLRTARTLFPDFELHAGLRFGINSLDGVLYARDAGANRAVLSKELTKKEVEFIAQRSPIDIEVYCHGPLCAAAPGNCYMSALLNHKSANLTYCQKPCLGSFGLGANSDFHPLSLKELSLGKHLTELENMGVNYFRIEAAYNRPEYIAVVTDIYARAIKNKRTVAQRDLEFLTDLFPAAGFTDAFYSDIKDADTFGYVKERTKPSSASLKSIRDEYMNNERQRVPVSLFGLVRKGVPAQIAAQDELGNTVKVSGAIPLSHGTQELTAVILQTQLYKTARTPYICTGARAIVEPGLYLDNAEITKMRTALLHELELKRRVFTPKMAGEFHPSLKYIGSDSNPQLTVSVERAEQLSEELAALKPLVLYVPLSELIENPATITPFWENGVTSICAVLPPIIRDSELEAVVRMLAKLREIHIAELLVNNGAHIRTYMRLGFKIRGNYGLNITNSYSLKHFKDCGLISAVLSFEMKLSDIKELSKCIDCEFIAYGRLPLMLTGSCVVKATSGVCNCDNNTHIKDKRGAVYPLLRTYPHRNSIFNSGKVYLADKQKDYQKIGLWAARLMFTTENEKECVQVVNKYLKTGNYEPASKTRGLYY